MPNEQAVALCYIRLWTLFSGLRAGDRLIEINGVNVEDDTHEDVFYRIKACRNLVTLLAVDTKTYACYKQEGMAFSQSQAKKQAIESEKLSW